MALPLVAIQELLGYSTTERTMRYAHPAPSTLAAAATALSARWSRYRPALLEHMRSTGLG